MTSQSTQQAMYQKFQTLLQDNKKELEGIVKKANFQKIDPSTVWETNGLEGFFERRKRAKVYGFMSRNKQGRMYKSFKIRSIYDMMRVDYPHLYDNQFMNQISKDAPLLSSTTAAYVATHGSNAFHQIIQEDNLRKLLPTKPYMRGGYRAITAAGSTSTIGVAENAAIPDTLKPTLANVDIGIKEQAYSFNVSARLQFLSMLEDDAWAEGGSAYDAMRIYMGIEFNKLINRELNTNVTTLASTRYETIDRIVSSNGEVTNCGDVDAGDSDIYSIDRDAGASWVDAYVAENANVDRPLTSALIKDVMTNVQPNWGGPQMGNQPGNYQNKIWVTGYDTKAEIEKIYENQNTYRNSGVRVAITLNGVQTLPEGSAAGMLVNTLYGIPLFVTNDAVQDTLSRLYLLDLNHLHFSMAIPTMYFQAGFSKGTPVELDAFQDKGVYYQMGELKATRFNVHGKLRDLS